MLINMPSNREEMKNHLHQLVKLLAFTWHAMYAIDEAERAESGYSPGNFGECCEASMAMEHICLAMHTSMVCEDAKGIISSMEEFIKSKQPQVREIKERQDRESESWPDLIEQLDHDNN